MARLIILFVAYLALTACSSGTPPDEQWEMAVQGVYSAALSEDANHAVIGSIHHGGSYWQVQPKERLYDWNHMADEKTGIVASAISDDGKYAVTCEHRKLVLWSTQTGEAFWLWEAPANIQAIDLDDQGSYALLGLDSYEAVLFDIRNGGVKRRLAHEGIVKAVDMTPDQKWAITGGDDSTVKVWDLQNGKLLNQWLLDNQIKTVAISHDGRYGFAASHRGITRIWDLQTGKTLADLPTISGHYRVARFNPNGQNLLTGTSAGQVQLWSVPKGDALARWAMPPRNAWVTKNTQVLDVAYQGNAIRAVGANGIVYHYKLSSAR